VVNAGHVSDDKGSTAVEPFSTRIGKSGGNHVSDIIIDANLIRNIGQGNRAAAEALQRLLQSGRKVYIARAAYDEVVVMSEQYRALLKELNIGVSPRSSAPASPGKPGMITARGNVYADNMLQKPKPSKGIPGPMTEYSGKKDAVTGLKSRPGDAFVAAEAKSLDAELWTLDQQFARQARQQGVKIAAESAIESVGGPESVATARQLLRPATPSLAPTPPAPASGPATAPKSVPTPTTGPVRPRLEALKAGIKGALSPESIASLIPDAILAIADKVAVRDAIRNIQTKFIKEGFAKGVAAGVMRWSKHDLAMNLKNRVTHYRVNGLGDAKGTLKLPDILRLAEAYENYAVDVGYQYTFSQSVGWNNDLQKKGLATLAKYGYHFGQDAGALFDYPFIDKLASVLRPTTDAIVGPAIKFH